MKSAPNARAQIHPAHCRCRACRQDHRRAAPLAPALGVAIALFAVSALIAAIA